MKHKLTRNIGLKAISLVVAMLIWFLIATINNPTTSKLFRDVSVEIINQSSVADIDKAFDVLDGDSVTLKVTERKSVLNNLTSSSFHVVADMENLNEMDAVPLTVTCDSALVTWDEIEISPASMKVQLETKRQSEFMVSISSSGAPEKGYEVGTMELLQGKSVQIAGPESLLNRIGRVAAVVNTAHLNENSVIPTVLQIFDKNDEELNEAQYARLQIMNASGVVLENKQVSVSVSIWEIRNGIPLIIVPEGTPAQGCQVSKISTLPESISLVGSSNAFKTLDENGGLTVGVSVEDAQETVVTDVNMQDVLAELDTDEIRLTSDADPNVTVTVELERIGDRTLEVPLSSITLENLPEGMNLTYSPADAIQVKVHSETENVYRLDIEDISAAVDLAPCANAGSYEIPVEIELPEGYDLLSDITIMVTAEKISSIQEVEKNTEASNG